MIPDDISRQDILDALDEFDREHRGVGRYDGWQDDGRFGYAIEHEGKRYPPKQIISLAGGISRDLFSGGQEANQFLREQGFTVKSLSEESSGDLRKFLDTVLSEFLEAKNSSDTVDSSLPVSKECSSIEESLQEKEVVRSRPHLNPRCSLGQGYWANVPWLAFLDERETTTTKKGVYCVYLFRADMSGVYLTFNQGVTNLREEHGWATARDKLMKRARKLRGYCGSLEDQGCRLDNEIDLKVAKGLGKEYEASTIAHKFYAAGDLPDEGALISDLDAVLGAYDSYLGDEFESSEWASAREGNDDTSIVEPREDLAAIVSDFSDALGEAHLTFGDRHEDFVRNFVVSLATKRFVILTGLSGSGKTQIAMQFGRWIGEDQYQVVPVRPDWTGSEALFGYPDALQPDDEGRRAWHVPDALKFMLRAANDPDRPYLMLLDEMNLAHVERYFADVISGMESGEKCIPNLRKEEGGYWRIPEGADERIEFPENLFIAGTVNIDETTYMFSPKVLDRANTIEFRVQAGDLTHDLRKPGDCEEGDEALSRGFLEIARNPDWHEDVLEDGGEELVGDLKELHRALDEGFAFGHRVVFEAMRFAALHREAGGDGHHEALDIQVLQKVLPRFHGSRRRLEPVLQAAGKFCWDLEADGAEEFDIEGVPEDEEPALPRSFEKLERMLERLQTNQFVSFTE